MRLETIYFFSLREQKEQANTDLSMLPLQLKDILSFFQKRRWRVLRLMVLCILSAARGIWRLRMSLKQQIHWRSRLWSRSALAQNHMEELPLRLTQYIALFQKAEHLSYMKLRGIHSQDSKNKYKLKTIDTSSCPPSAW